ELVNIDGAPINILRLDSFLSVSACPTRDKLFVILPRNSKAPVGLLASEIVDTPTQPVTLDELAYRPDGVLGTATMRGQIALFLDINRLVTMWEYGQNASRP